MRQAALFGALERPVPLIDERGDVMYYPRFLDFEEGDALVTELLATSNFSADSRMMYGKRVNVPRLQARHGDDGIGQPWTPRLLDVRWRLEELLRTHFDWVFVNNYRDGRDSVAWHGDHDSHVNRIVASLSLGATREFDLRPKRESGLRPRTIALDVAHGDLIVMRGETQAFWEHRVRKDPRVHERRINLTYRQHIPTHVSS